MLFHSKHNSKDAKLGTKQNLLTELVSGSYKRSILMFKAYFTHISVTHIFIAYHYLT